MRTIVTLGLAMLLIAHSTPSWAEAQAQEGTLSQVGSGVGSAIGTFVYFPFKAAFCIVGGVASGFTAIFAGSDSAGKVARTACGGSWVITPGVIKGKETMKFAGDAVPSQQRPSAR